MGTIFSSRQVYLSSFSDTHTHTHTHNGGCHFDTLGSCSQVACTAFRVPGNWQELLSCFVVACCHGYCTSQCSDLAQLAPTSKGLSISHYVQRLTLQWITLSTLLMMAHKAETAVQRWSVDPMEDVILTHTPPPPSAFQSWSVSVPHLFLLVQLVAILRQDHKRHDKMKPADEASAGHLPSSGWQLSPELWKSSHWASTEQLFGAQKRNIIGNPTISVYLCQRHLF